MIIGQHEIIGLEDTIAKNKKASYTVTCYTHEAEAYFIPKKVFLELIKSFNLEKLSQIEVGIKTSIYL